MDDVSVVRVGPLVGWCWFLVFWRFVMPYGRAEMLLVFDLDYCRVWILWFGLAFDAMLRFGRIVGGKDVAFGERFGIWMCFP